MRPGFVRELGWSFAAKYPSGFSMVIDPLVNKHSYGKWPFIVDFPIEHGDFL